MCSIMISRLTFDRLRLASIPKETIALGYLRFRDKNSGKIYLHSTISYTQILLFDSSTKKYLPTDCQVITGITKRPKMVVLEFEALFWKFNDFNALGRLKFSLCLLLTREQRHQGISSHIVWCWHGFVRSWLNF